MKELNIKDCQLVTGGAIPVVVWAAAGVASYLGNKLYSGEEITAIGIISSAAGGAIGGGASAAIRVGASLRPVAGGFAGGATEGFIHNSYQGIRNSISSSPTSNKNQSGSDYGDGCNYQ